MNSANASKQLLAEIVSSDSGVDCTNLEGPQRAMARLLIEKGLVMVNQDGWFGPRFVATPKGRRLAENQIVTPSAVAKPSMRGGPST